MIEKANRISKNNKQATAQIFLILLPIPEGKKEELAENAVYPSKTSFFCVHFSSSISALRGRSCEDLGSTVVP